MKELKLIKNGKKFIELKKKFYKKKKNKKKNN